MSARPETGWSSRMMFVVAAAASAVGLANIWKFPYIVGEHGGGAFVLLYLLCLLFLGLPILIAEIMIGRSGGERPSSAFLALARERSLSPRWRYLGALGSITCLLILSYYAVVCGWIAVYAVDYLYAAAGAAPAVAPDGLAPLIADARSQFLAFTGILGFGFLVVARNGTAGIEAAVKYLAPLFLLLMGGLLIHTLLTSPAAGTALAYVFRPDFGALTLRALPEAIGHAFFTLSVGMSAMVVYGAYLGKDADIPHLALWVAGVDTAISLGCAVLVFAIVFANGLDPQAGPGLIFAALPIAFGQMSGGQILGAAFFLVVLIAGVSSVLAVMVVATRWIEERFGLATPHAAGACAASIFAGGAIMIAVESGALDGAWLGGSLMGLLDGLVSSVLLPASGIGIALFGAKALRQDLAHARFGAALLFCLIYVAPVALVLAASAQFA